MYDGSFYGTIRAGCQASAAVMAPIVYNLLKPATVLDVGCGEGWWAKAFQDCGADVVGLDGPGAQPVIDHFIVHDLAAEAIPVRLRGLGLTVCLEVAEHLPPQRAESFIAELCATSKAVLFSAAIPGQGGTGHVNEQPPSYWVDLFDRQGYDVTGALRWKIWNDERVENWYRQNLLLAVKRPIPKPARGHSALTDLFRGPLAEPFHVVHPVLFDARRR